MGVSPVSSWHGEVVHWTWRQVWEASHIWLACLHAARGHLPVTKNPKSGLHVDKYQTLFGGENQ